MANKQNPNSQKPNAQNQKTQQPKTQQRKTQNPSNNPQKRKNPRDFALKKSKINILQSGIVNITQGKNFCVVNPTNLYGCHFGDNCFVGPFVEVQSEVTIGHNCRIQSHSFICSLTRIGDECFIGHGAMFVNDLFSEGKPNASKSKWRGANIGNRVSIGSNATILPVKICDNVVIGAGSVVTKDITKSGIYAGNPAKKLRDL